VSAFIGLQCHLCKATFPAEAVYVCDQCLGPLEPVYDYAAIQLTREEIERRPKNLWRYQELLPIVGEPHTGFHSGFTPLVRCTRLAERIGVGELYIKDDSVNHPTLSYKDRVVSVAATRAVELGMEVLACASTGNLANSVAAHAARLGLECCVFIPDDLEAGKILGSAIFGPTILAIAGTYDDVNRLCTQVADRLGWGFVNINLRSYYAEGAKTYGFEIAEQLGWRLPGQVVVPIASGAQLVKVDKGFTELTSLGLVPHTPWRVFGAQATGCSPVSAAFAAGHDVVRPVRPDTIAKSLAIGNPADGPYVLDVVRRTGGAVADVSDDEVIDSIRLLAASEGIFGETAGGVTVGVLRKLLKEGRLDPEAETVIINSGDGLKTLDAVAAAVDVPAPIRPTLEAFAERYSPDR
jgi:threonine synthase